MTDMPETIWAKPSYGECLVGGWDNHGKAGGVEYRRADLPAQDPTPALGWMAAREAAAETVRAILVRDGDHTQARQPECADKMFKYAEELPAAIRALPAPTSAQLLAEAMKLPEIAALLAAAKGAYYKGEDGMDALGAAIKDASHD